MENLAVSPVFVLGIMPRSGTNFFFNLLRLHPQCNCVTNSQMNEDYLLYHADLLARYAETVCNYWKQHWKYSKKPPVNEAMKEEILKGLGDGLISYLKHQYDDGRVLVTKTPQVRNLNYFFKLFPNAKLVILVRDGRAVVESLVQSFGWSHEKAIQKWTEAAQSIISFDQTHENSQFKYLVVKYEDILDNFEEAINRIFEKLDLKVSLYDFDAAKKLPIMGSSQFWANGTDKEKGWKRVEKTKDFDPRSRWQNWPQSLHSRFNWVAGDCMAEFGYEAKNVESTYSLNSFWNHFLDRKWEVRNHFKLTIGDLEKNFYAMYLYNQNFRNFIPEN